MSGPVWVAAAMGGAAVFDDLRRRRISNRITVAGLAAALALAACEAGPRGLAMAAAGAALGFLLLLPSHCMGGMGGGDLKLMAAFGALLGPVGIVTTAVLAAIAGALTAVAVAVLRPRTAAIPLAPAIVAGAWLAMLGRG